MMTAITVELRKLRKSPVVWTTTALLATLMPAMALGFYQVGVNGGAGAVAAKAQAFLIQEGWPGYLSGVAQIAAVAMFLGSGIVVTWVFGREHTDKTFAALFAMPVSRGEIALGKLAVLSAWTVIVSFLATAVGVCLGVVAGIGPVASGEIAGHVWRLFAVCISASLVALPVGYVASVGRGYLPAIGALIIAIAVAQAAVLFGTGQWFPFAVPGLMAVAGAEGVPSLSVPNLLVLPTTIATGAALTVRWWHVAEAV
jgi:ABC-2 type transport system permease protein